LYARLEKTNCRCGLAGLKDERTVTEIIIGTMKGYACCCTDNKDRSFLDANNAKCSNVQA